MAWDTLDTQPYCVQSGLLALSGGNLTATSLTSGSAYETHHVIAQPFEGKRSGKWCIEIRCITQSANDGFAGYDRIGMTGSAGICQSGGNGYGMLGTTGGAGFGAQFGISFGNVGYSGGNYVVIDIARFYLIGQNDTAAWNIGHYNNGDYLYIAADLDNNLFWFRINNGNWLGMTNPGDPVAGTGGVAYSQTGSSPFRYYPAVSLGPGGEYTFNLGATGFHYPAPSGFTAGWTNNSLAILGSQLSNGLGGFLSGQGTRVLAVSPYISSFTGNINNLISTGDDTDTTEAIGVIYDSDGAGSAPGTLLGIGSSGFNQGGTEFVHPLPSPLSITSGHTYYLGVFLAHAAGYGPFSDVCLAGGAADGLYIDTTAVWPTPNSTFTASPTLVAAHLPMLASGVRHASYTQGHVF